MIKHDYTTYTLSFHCIGWLGAGFTVTSWMIDGAGEYENETENDDGGSTDRATHKSIEEQIRSSVFQDPYGVTVYSIIYW